MYLLSKGLIMTETMTVFIILMLLVKLSCSCKFEVNLHVETICKKPFSPDIVQLKTDVNDDEVDLGEMTTEPPKFKELNNRIGDLDDGKGEAEIIPSHVICTLCG